MKVVITGARGAIGRKLTDSLGDEHELVLLSRSQVPDDPRWRQVDIADLSPLVSACEGADAIVHLAIAPGHEGDYEDDAFNALRFDTNVKGTFNVFEAARKCAVPRVIYTSSLTVVWGYVAPAWVEADAPAGPVGTYALTKHLGEQIAQHYAQVHDVSCLCLRIPKPIDLEDEASKAQPILPQWVAFPDLVQAYRLALQVRHSGFDILTIVGESSRRRWDLSRAERLLGYCPQYRLEDLGYRLREEPASYAGPNVVWGDQ